MKNDQKLETPPEGQGSEHAVDRNDARVEARRRFLRMGAGGTAALVVTVMHRRAFASGGIKKNVIASACTSLQGVPDLKNTKSKKALETSAMGTPKNLICRRNLPDRKNPPNLCGTGSEKSAKYGDSSGNFNYIDYPKLNDGCGAVGFTVDASKSYRLYEKGWCPIKYDVSGLNYDISAKYFTRDAQGNLVANACKFQ